MAAGTHNKGLERQRAGELQDVVEVILDKGMVIDSYVRVTPADLIELMRLDGRMVSASVDTYLRLASAVDRLAA